MMYMNMTYLWRCNMHLRELFGDWLMNTSIVTEAMDRSSASTRINGLTTPLVKHLVKIIRWDDPVNFAKHIRDIDDWIEQIDDVLITGNKRPTQRDYDLWITDYANKNMAKWIRRLNKDYGTLPELNDERTTLHEVNLLLNAIVADLVADNFYSVERYLID